MSRSVRFTLLAPWLLASPALAHTWIVDAAGGGDFLDLPPAIAAATSGDILLVMPGNYSAFTLDKALVILGQGPDVIVNGPPYAVQLSEITSGVVAVLADLRFASCTASVVDCTVPVVVDSVSGDAGAALPVFDVVGALDLRVRAIPLVELTLQPGPGHVATRVEFAESELWGKAGMNGSEWHPDGEPGGSALAVFAGARAHLYRSNLTGGDGGIGLPPWNIDGEGGSGIVVFDSASVLVAGQARHVVAGGFEGHGYGPQAVGVSNGGAVRISGVTTSGLGGAGAFELPDPPDPTLGILAPPKAGRVTTFRVHAAPGANVELLLGRKPGIVDVPGLAEDRLLVPSRTFQLGVVGASGALDFDFPLPASLPKGSTCFAQAKVTFAPSDWRYSNSVPLVVR